MIKYLGSKRLLTDAIVARISALPNVRVVADLFSGTARVGHALKAAGYRVHSNDHNRYAATLARCHVMADADKHGPQAERAIQALAEAPPIAPHWFTETYCETARYFHPKNGPRIAGMRTALDALHLDEPVRSVVLTALIEAADRVDSTVGVQMAFLKKWAARAEKDIALRMPALLPRPVHGACTVSELEALEAAERTEADVVYLDPPYNQHSYLGNYHVWETLARWDAPETYGIAQKRVDVRARKSPFNRKNECLPALEAVVAAARAPFVVVSFSDEGYISRAAMEAMLSAHGTATTEARVHPRYVGAKIGIHDKTGKKVGRVGKLKNTEFIYVLEKR